MPSHIIVIFDHSSSMSGEFSRNAFANEVRGEYASHATKIEEAKAQLVAWLTTSVYDKVTIIPFSDKADRPEFFYLPKDLSNVRIFLESIKADGSTNLAKALQRALTRGLDHTDRWFVRYLIVTDGLSNAPSHDLELVRSLPHDQGIDAILIDPTPEGESHLRRLCIRGRYIPVFGAQEMKDALAERDQAYRIRTQLRETLSALLSKADQLGYEISGVLEDSSEKGDSGVTAEGSQLHKALLIAVSKGDEVRKQLANADFSESLLQEILLKLEETCRRAEDFVDRHRESYQGEGRVHGAKMKLGLEHVLLGASMDDASLEEVLGRMGISRFILSLAHPRRLSKGYSSFFLVQVYNPVDRRRAKRRISEMFGSEETKETTGRSNVVEGHSIKIRLSSSDVVFSEPVKKAVKADGIHVEFWGKPKDTSRPGEHPGLLSIDDAVTGQQYDSMPFTVRIVDYAFDHVSRPLLGKAASAAAGLASIASFMLTFLGDIDKTLGLASGTATLVLAAILIGPIASMYRSPTVTVQKPLTFDI